MTDSDTLAARLDALEIRSAHQDLTIEELNEAVAAQWKRIETLTRRLVMLQDIVREMGEARPGEGQPEPPPPHY